MKHHRRRKLLKALNDLYLDNWKTSASYTEQQRTIQSLATIGEKIRQQHDRDQPRQGSTQLLLFVGR